MSLTKEQKKAEFESLQEKKMRISEKKRSLLYGAIHRATMNTRCIIANNEDIREVDDLLFKLNGEIWSKVKNVLNIKQ